MSDPALTSRAFELLRQLVHRQTGIHLASSKRALLESRLRRRIRELGMPDFLAYYRSIREGTAPDDELQQLVDAITTQTTSFFRERVHFDFLTNELAPAWARRGGSLRLWSAACSTG